MQSNKALEGDNKTTDNPLLTMIIGIEIFITMWCSCEVCIQLVLCLGTITLLSLSRGLLANPRMLASRPMARVSDYDRMGKVCGWVVRGECSEAKGVGEGDLPEWLTTFLACFSIDFFFFFGGKAVEKVANDLRMWQRPKCKLVAKRPDWVHVTVWVLGWL